MIEDVGDAPAGYGGTYRGDVPSCWVRGAVDSAMSFAEPGGPGIMRGCGPGGKYRVFGDVPGETL
jgi:hypothetical protein